MLLCDHKLGYILRRAQKVSSRLPGWPLDWESRASDPDVLGLSLDVQQIRYVDMTGTQHEVTFEDVDGAFLDPLGNLLASCPKPKICLCCLRSMSQFFLFPSRNRVLTLHACRPEVYFLETLQE